MQKILSGYRVLELSTVLAGPLVGSFLSEMGADVVKVEPPGGDVTRGWKLPSEKLDAVSAYYCAANVGKRVVELNLKSTEGREQLIELVQSSDIVISNYLPKVAEKLETSYNHLKAIKAEVIMCELQGFVADSKRAAYDAVMQAETGWMSMNGSAQSGPLKMPVALMDLFAAHHMKQAILLAIIKQLKSGEGSHIQCTLEASSVSNLANQSTNYLMADWVPGLKGSLHPNIAPYGELLHCSDGKRIMLAVGTDSQFFELCDMLGLDEAKKDARFGDNQSRVRNRKTLHLLIKKATSERDSLDLDSALHSYRIPACVVRSIDEVLDREQLQQLIVEDENGRRITTVPFTIK